MSFLKKDLASERKFHHSTITLHEVVNMEIRESNIFLNSHSYDENCFTSIDRWRLSAFQEQNQEK